MTQLGWASSIASAAMPPPANADLNPNDKG